MSDLGKRIEQLPPEKRALLELLMQRKGLSRSPVGSIPRVPERDSYPLSFAQQRLWFMDQMEPGSPFYNEPLLAIRIRGPLDSEVLVRTFDEIVRRHESLRTTFANVDGKPVQRISPPAPAPVTAVDLRGLPAGQREVKLRELAQEEAGRPFDLSAGPLLRVTIVRLGGEDHTVLIEMHHIITDGWSNRILLREMMQLYDAASKGRPNPLPGLPIRYVDFAVWQNQWLKGKVLEELTAYWKRQLGGRLPVLQLPTDFPRPAVQRYIGRLETRILDRGLSEKVKQLCRGEDCTLFMTLFAAFLALLYRYTRQEDLVIGCPVANRNRVETEGVIGFFVNTLVLRVDVSGNPRFTELMRRVKKVAVDAYAHEDLPFEKMVEILQPERDLSRQALFQVLFVLHNYPGGPGDVQGLGQDLTLTRIEVDGGESKMDFAMAITDLEEEGIKAQINYSTDLFKTQTVRRMLRQYESLLRSVTANPETCLSAIRISSEEDEGGRPADLPGGRGDIARRLKSTTRKPVIIAPPGEES